MASSEVRPGQMMPQEAPIYSENPLARVIEEEIDKSGPIPFDKYMNIWLYGGKAKDGNVLPGYYTSGEAVIGDDDGRRDTKNCDFITPCEYTPLYGYCMAGQMLEMREALDKPTDFTIVEMGAGNGTLAYDILNGIKERVEKGEADVAALKTRYLIVERSAALIERQRAKLKDFESKVDFVHGSASEIPLSSINGVFLSVELPDAFPTHVVRKGGTADKPIVEELLMGRGDSENFDEVWTPFLTPDVAEYLSRHKPTIDEDYVAVNTNSTKWIKDIGNALNRGFVVTVDYFDKGKQVVRTYASDAKGEADLEGVPESKRYLNKRAVGKVDMTQGVDFHALADAGKDAGLSPVGYVNNQGFLWGLSYDLLMYKGDEINFGNRLYNLPFATKLFKSHSWDVMVQAKGVGDSHFVSLSVPFDFEGERPDAQRYILD